MIDWTIDNPALGAVWLIAVLYSAYRFHYRRVPAYRALMNEDALELRNRAKGKLAAEALVTGVAWIASFLLLDWLY
jgi:hypothetical protein